MQIESDPQVSQAYNTLTPGKQRRILYVVGKPRSESTRLTKATGATAYLQEVGAASFDYAGLLEFLQGWR